MTHQKANSFVIISFILLWSLLSLFTENQLMFDTSMWKWPFYFDYDSSVMKIYNVKPVKFIHYCCENQTNATKMTYIEKPQFRFSPSHHDDAGSTGTGLWVRQEAQSRHGGHQHTRTTQLDLEAANDHRTSPLALPAHWWGRQQHRESDRAGPQPCTLHQASADCTVENMNVDIILELGKRKDLYWVLMNMIDVSSFITLTWICFLGSWIIKSREQLLCALTNQKKK